jgi:hypothetical protein
VLAPLRAFGPPLADSIRPMSLLEANTLIDPPEQTAGWKNYQGGHSLTELSDGALDALVEGATSCPAPFALIVLEHQHGAACRVTSSATAYEDRQEHYILLATAAWPSGKGEPYVAWVRQFQASMEPFARQGTYINYLEDEGEGRIRASYGVNYDRLVQVKNVFDPTNFFQVNQNIKPSL